MAKNASRLIVGLVGVGGFLGLIVGLWTAHWILTGLSAVASCYAAGRGCVLGRLGRQWTKTAARPPAQTPHDNEIVSKKKTARRPVDTSAPSDTESLVEQMLIQGRYALLLRKQVAACLSEDQGFRAMEALDEAMALVPEGDVLLRDEQAQGEDEEPDQGRVVRVEAVFLDRYPVTNRQFREFVAAGGYEEMALWDEEIWSGVLDFLDRTGAPGPRFWRDGGFPAGEDDHPVVGVSWYEAAAYARWVGKRLPTDPEWVKAGSWPVPVPAAVPVQRKYPWGDSMDHKRANVWGAEIDRTVPVTEFRDGVSVGGVYGLIGNVWEWTSSRFGQWRAKQGRLASAVPFKSLRGGAFDTYFDNQATCQFQSGDSPLARKRNIGFRCALGVCDLAPPDSCPKESREEHDDAALAGAAAPGSHREEQP